MAAAELGRFSIERADGGVAITAPAPKSLWSFISPVCWLLFIFSAAINIAEKFALVALSLVFAISLRRLYANDSITVNADSFSVRQFAGLSYQTKLYQASEIKFVGFYPAFLGGRTSFGIAMIVKSKMIPLLHIQGQEAANVFDELSRIPWLTPKILPIDRDLLFREKERRPFKAAWSGLTALMAKPLRLPRL